ncbi:hypothetical protein P879_06195 [Paragonimus westermani]|uniref:Protein bicaudal D n=1 Tax=Paragonimus westermani TaxID=34504 RepID=A0A8T0D8U7_9TREM|nr:hypothetical protein P879_06195 [Paragonimus westermani]
MSVENSDTLKEENRKLQSELQEALQLKLEAAQYGLRILEEKQHIQAQYDELVKKSEELHEEVQMYKRKLEEQSLIQRRMSMVGFEEEQDFLSKYSSREQQLLNQVQDLEVELKDMKVKYERQLSDNDSLHQKISEHLLKHEEFEKEHQRLKSELKETKLKESRLMGEFDDLEAENLDLQKTILSLKTSQVEFESLRHEFKRVQEENEIIHSQLEEITRLKRMTEKSLEEALESLQIERDQRHNLRKELDSRLTSESLYHLSNLHSDLKGSANLNHTAPTGITPTIDHPMDKLGSSAVVQLGTSSTSIPNSRDGGRTSSNNLSQKCNSSTPNCISPGNLFTELRSSELEKFQTDIAQLEGEKNELSRTLEETQRSLELATSEVSNKQERINGLLAQLDTIMSVKSQADSEFEAKEAERGSPIDSALLNHKDSMTESSISILIHLDESDEEVVKSHPVYKRLRKALRLSENRYSVALRQIGSMQHDLWRYRERDKLNSRPELATEAGLKKELIHLQATLDQRAEEIKQLHNSLLAGQEANRTMDKQLNSFSKELHRGLTCLFDIYSIVCSAMKENPTKQMLDLAERVNVPIHLHKDSPDESVASDLTGTTDDGDRNGPMDAANSSWTETLSVRVDGQLSAATQLRHFINTFVGKYTQIVKQSVGQSSLDLEEAQQEVLRLKNSVETKREQIVVLRNMLRANKATAETALANLKQKYEKEKVLVKDTMQRLRNELKTLKEDAATYASLRAMFAQRYDEYITQMDELQRKLNMAEEEKRTVNSLLRLAIQQKLALTQRLEEYEMDCEQRQSQALYAPQPQRSYANALSSLPAPVFQPNHPSLQAGTVNSLLPNPVHPQQPYSGVVFNPRPPLAYSQPPMPVTSAQTDVTNSGLSTHPHHPMLSPQHHKPGAGSKEAVSSTDRSKRAPRTKREDGCQN